MDNIQGVSEEEYMQQQSHVSSMLLLSNIVTLFQIVNALSIRLIEIKWLKSSHAIDNLETFFSSEAYKWFSFDIVVALVQPYWFLMGVTYKNTKYNEHTQNILFQVNDGLTVLKIFCTMIPIYIFLVELSRWTDPKSARCCAIFGVKADVFFGVKALMVSDPIKMIIYAFVFSLI